MKQERKARKELRRLMECYEASQRSVSSSYFAQSRLQHDASGRSPTPVPVADDGYTPSLAGRSTKYYSTEPLSPIEPALEPACPASSAASVSRKRNFSFFKWTGSGSRKSSNSNSDASLSPTSPWADDVINAIAAVPKSELPNLPPASTRTSAGGISRIDTFSTSSGSYLRPMSTHSRYSTAPSSLRNTAPSTSTTSSAILAHRSSSDTLRSQYTFPRSLHSFTECNPRFPPDAGRSRGLSNDDLTPQPCTMADFFLLGNTGSIAVGRRRRTTPAHFGSRNSSAVTLEPKTGRDHLTTQRPTTSGSGSLASLRRRHSISSDLSLPLSAGSPRPSQDGRREAPIAPSSNTKGGAATANMDPYAAMFVPGYGKKPRSTLCEQAKHSQKQLPVDVHSPPPPPPSDHLDPLHSPLPPPPSSLLLDAFMSLLDEYSSAPKLFSFSRPKPAHVPASPIPRRSKAVSRQASFVTTKTSQSTRETIREETSFLSSKPDSQDNTSSGSNSEDDNCGTEGILFYTSSEEVEYIQEKQKLEPVVWFLCASKWLSFGRLLFSPGHHLLNLGQNETDLLGLDDMRILDLDGPALGGWSWHLATEYPAAIVYNITTSETYFRNYGINHMQPLNHRLVLTESLTSLQPLESNSFDVITARALPRVLEKHEWIPLLKECHRVLKQDGYLELTIVDALLNNMGPITKAWIEENIIQAALGPVDGVPTKGDFDIRPSKSIMQNLEVAGLMDIHKCWVWMPAGTIGDELSSVTSRVGRYFYDELFTGWGKDSKQKFDQMTNDGIRPHRELELWNDPRVQAECVRENTAFRWLKCHARKGRSQLSGSSES
ncbi:hypothetical protein BDZ91DRAFT_347630 [Kalaharituber pfeilii]|nr:hypothetical protein BDZ91DRAFT_347630 [Kalaharituber pfeilii]